MSDFRANHSIREADILVPVQTTLGVSTTSTVDLANPAVIKLVEQGGTIASLLLTCLFVWLLTQLIKAAKED